MEPATSDEVWGLGMIILSTTIDGKIWPFVFSVLGLIYLGKTIWRSWRKK